VPSVTSSFPLVGNLLGLPNGWARGLGSVGTAQTPYVDDFCGAIFFGTGSSVNPAGNIFLFVVTAEEGGRFTDGVNPSSTASQDALIGAATQSNLVQQLGGPRALAPLAVNTMYSFAPFSIKALLGGTPTFWAPLIWNLSGFPLSVTIAPYAAHTLQT
jgi:hypothetical protein